MLIFLFVQSNRRDCRAVNRTIYIISQLTFYFNGVYKKLIYFRAELSTTDGIHFYTKLTIKKPEPDIAESGFFGKMEKLCVLFYRQYRTMIVCVLRSQIFRQIG
jgi:hypothetical protein